MQSEYSFARIPCKTNGNDFLSFLHMKHKVPQGCIWCLIAICQLHVLFIPPKCGRNLKLIFRVERNNLRLKYDGICIKWQIRFQFQLSSKIFDSNWSLLLVLGTKKNQQGFYPQGDLCVTLCLCLLHVGHPPHHDPPPFEMPHPNHEHDYMTAHFRDHDPLWICTPGSGAIPGHTFPFFFMLSLLYFFVKNPTKEQCPLLSTGWKEGLN